MTEKKHRLGQKKQDGTTATPKPLCPKCKESKNMDEILQRAYTREKHDGKWQYVPTGWQCKLKTCDYIAKDFVELEDI